MVENAKTKDAETAKKRPTIAGKAVELHAESLFINKRENGTPLISMVARKRRDVDANAPYAGAYVSNREVDRKDGTTMVSHSQIINRESLNKILKANDKDELSEDQVKDMAGNQEPLATGKDGLVFTANVFSDDNKGHHGPNNSWTHVIGQNSIEASAHPFDYEKDHSLSVAAKESKAAAKAEKKTAAPKAKAKTADVEAEADGLEM